MQTLGKRLASIVMIGFAALSTGCATAPSPAVVMPAHTAARLSFEASSGASMQLINEGQSSISVTLHRTDAADPSRTQLSPGTMMDVSVNTVTAIEFENRSYDEAVVRCESDGVENLTIDPIVGVITTPYYAGVTE